jgi:hypothetical protein
LLDRRNLIERFELNFKQEGRLMCRLREKRQRRQFRSEESN